MATSTDNVTRRRALVVAGLGAAAAVALPVSKMSAAEMSAAEKANVQVVNDFCAAWPAHDVARIMSFFADNCAYRVTETQEPYKGREAVTGRVKAFIASVKEFKVLDTWAKGPMVFNERIDSFSGGPLKSWHGTGVFFLKDGKIVEWYDYTIAIDRG
jgi:limonene-1,2-epoxide hydrolase